MTQRLIGAAIAAFLLAGCAHEIPPPIILSGNGKCHPSQSLPVHKTVKQVEPADTFIARLFDLLTDERKAHGTDVRDYNQLYDECVGPTIRSGGK